VAVDRVVTREQADAVFAVQPDEVAVLLVGQGLQRSGVEGLSLLGQRSLDRVLGDERLPRPCGRGDEDRPPGVERVERPALEVVELEVQPGLEREARAHPPGALVGVESGVDSAGADETDVSPGALVTVSVVGGLVGDGEGDDSSSDGARTNRSATVTTSTASTASTATTTSRRLRRGRKVVGRRAEVIASAPSR